jgi:SAM-dependent methyltransferase
MSKDRIRKHYEPLIGDDVPGHRAADWSDEFAQQIRFAVLGDNVELAGRSLLDVGCGTGDLWAFLHEREIETDYLGVDLVDKAIAEARRRHPDGRFEVVDVFQPGIFEPGSFDVVFSSGAFNLDLGNNREFLPAAVARLIELAREVTAFNLLHARAASTYSHCFYWQPEEVRDMLADLCGRVEIIDDYLMNDFTVICRK